MFHRIACDAVYHGLVGVCLEIILRIVHRQVGYFVNSDVALVATWAPRRNEKRTTFERDSSLQSPGFVISRYGILFYNVIHHQDPLSGRQKLLQSLQPQLHSSIAHLQGALAVPSS